MTTAEDEFNRLIPQLQASLDYSLKTHSVEDVRKAVEEGKMHFWPVGNSLVVTELAEYPQAKILNVFIAGGNAEEIMKIQPNLQSWANHLGCSHVGFLGRKGWSPFLRKTGWTDHKMNYFSIEAN